MVHNKEVKVLLETAAKLEASAKELRKEAQGLSHRGTGRSTSQALAVLNAAYTHPGVVIGVADHSGTNDAHYMLRRRILDMAIALGLHGFVACGMNSNHTADGHSFGVKYIKPTL